MMAFCPEHPKRDQNPKFLPPKRDDEHPHTFHMGVPPGIKVVFEPHMSTGSEAFFPLMCLDVAKFVPHLYCSVALLLLRRFSWKFGAKPPPNNAKSSFSVYVRRSKTSLLSYLSPLPLAFHMASFGMNPFNCAFARWSRVVEVNLISRVFRQLTPRTQDLEVQGSSLASRVVSLDKELYFTLNGYRRHSAGGNSAMAQHSV